MNSRPSLSFVILSHHSYRKISHTIQVKVGERRFYFCARCTGIVIGMPAGLLYLNYLSTVFLQYPILIFVFTLPAIIDWLLQVFEYRDSSNPRRILTGALVGQTYLVGLIAIIKGWFPLLSEYALVYAVYTVILYILFRVTGVMKDYLARSWPNG